MAKRRTGRNVHGWVALDKPTGMSSAKALNDVQRLLDAKKAGHAGTLDPMASGVLPLAFGEATKTDLGGHKFSPAQIDLRSI